MLRLLRRTNCLLAILALSACCGAVTPDWVRNASGQTVNGADKDTSAAVLLDEQTTTVADAGETFTLYRRVVKILRPQGREHAEMPIFYDNETRLKSVHAWSVTASGQEYELKEKDFFES